MNYLINNFVIYDTIKGELYTHNKKDVVRLSKTLNRLMLFFVKNSNKNLSKESILLCVWQGHNQVVSDNNLNSNISVLRRHLSSFFDEDMIITIPKIGFKFSAQVVVKKVDNEKNDYFILSGIIPKFLTFINKKENFILILIVVIVSCIIFFIKNRYKDESIIYPMIGKIDECIIYYIHDNYKQDMKKKSMNMLQEKIIDLKINCNSPAKIYYYYTSSIGTEGYDKGISFLSYCPKLSKEKTVMSCETFYEK